MVFRAAEVIIFHFFPDHFFSDYFAFLVLMNHNHDDYAVSGGHVSLIQGSYEYHHYLQDGFDDSVKQISSCKFLSFL